MNSLPLTRAAESSLPISIKKQRALLDRSLAPPYPATKMRALLLFSKQERFADPSNAHNITKPRIPAAFIIPPRERPSQKAAHPCLSRGGSREGSLPVQPAISHEPRYNQGIGSNGPSYRRLFTPSLYQGDPKGPTPGPGDYEPAKLHPAPGVLPMKCSALVPRFSSPGKVVSVEDGNGSSVLIVEDVGHNLGNDNVHESHESFVLRMKEKRRQEKLFKGYKTRQSKPHFSGTALKAVNYLSERILAHITDLSRISSLSPPPREDSERISKYVTAAKGPDVTIASFSEKGKQRPATTFPLSKVKFLKAIGCFRKEPIKYCSPCSSPTTKIASKVDSDMVRASVKATDNKRKKDVESILQVVTDDNDLSVLKSHNNRSTALHKNTSEIASSFTSGLAANATESLPCNNNRGFIASADKHPFVSAATEVPKDYRPDDTFTYGTPRGCRIDYLAKKKISNRKRVKTSCYDLFGNVNDIHDDELLLNKTKDLLKEAR